MKDEIKMQGTYFQKSNIYLHTSIYVFIIHCGIFFIQIRVYITYWLLTYFWIL